MNPFKRAARMLGNLTSKAYAEIIPNWEVGRPSYGSHNFGTYVREGYKKNELIFACIERASKTSAQISLRVRSQKDQEPLPDHPLQKLIDRPNRFMSQADFWSAVIIYLKLAGRAVFEKERNRMGQIIGLWPLRPDWLEVVPASGTSILRYEYGPPGTQKYSIAPDDILQFKNFSPLGLLDTVVPVKVAARIGDVDNTATDFIKLFFEKGGAPAGMLVVKKKLNDAAIENIRQRWSARYGGTEHWLAPAVLDTDAEFHQVGSSIKDMGFEFLDSRSEARICMALDVPPILVGAKVGLDRATYSNYGEARTAWWQDSLLPMFRSFIDEIESGLLPEFESGVIVQWDTSNIPALQEDEELRWRRANDALRSGGITVNMYLEEIGKMPIGPAGDVFLRPMTSIEVPLKTPKALVVSMPDQKATPRPPDFSERLDAEQDLQKVLAAEFDDQLTKLIEAVNAGG